MPVKLATPAWSRSVLSVFIAVFFCCVSVSAQDGSGYYFPSQNRFVPSSGSFPRQQQTLNGFRSGNNGVGYSPAPGSYQEQLLFIANENNSNNNNKQQAAIAANSPYGTPFGASSQQFAKPNRQSEYYDISPRPFGVPVVGGGATSVVSAAPPPSGLTRTKAIRNGASLGTSLNSFQPQSAQTQRVNVPHQQTQFLAHFSENEKRLPATSNSAAVRPFGNGGFSPSLTRTRTQAPPPAAAAPVEDATPQAASPYRLRNRFQPGTSSPPSSTSTTTSSAEVSSSKRYNRFGSNRATSKTTSTTTSSTTSAPASERPSFGRKPPNPRRPVFISREVNEPVSVVSKRPFQFNNSARQKLLLRPTSSTTSTTEGLSEAEDSNEQYEQEEEEEVVEEVEEQEQPQQEQVEQKQQLEQQAEPASLEKLPLQEQTSSPIAISQESSSSPEYSTTSTEESSTDASDSSDFTEETTLSNPSHEYEYVEEHDEKATTTAMPASKEEEKEATEEQLETETTELPDESLSTTSNAPEDAADAEHNQSTADAPEESPKSSSSKQEDESEYDDEEGEEGDEEYEYDEEEEVEDGTGHEESHSDANLTTESDSSSLQEATHSREAEVDNQEHLDEREIISVVTTKSVVNGSTAYPAPPVTPSSFGSTTIADSQPAPQAELEEHTEPTSSKDAIETTPQPGDDASTPNVTESYVVVASIQTSRSINGARFLPFPAIEQEETKQTLSELERKVHSKQQQKQAELTESSEEPTTTTSTSTTTTTTTETPSSISSGTTERSLPSASQGGVSTESIIDKLDRVQSELSSGVLSGKYPIISHQMDSSTPASTTTTGTHGKFVPNIRKFQPRTTTAPSTTSSGASKMKVQHLHEMDEMDELAGLLPVGFKPKSSYKNRKITTTTEAPAQDQLKKPERNSTISRSFKNGAVAVQDVALAGLLPKGYRPPKTTTTRAPKSSGGGLESLFSEVKFDDSLAALLPKDYPLNTTKSAKPAISPVDDISKFLPAGFSPSPTTTQRTTTTQRSPAVAVPFDDLSKFLPPGYKPPSKEQPEAEPKVTKVADISSFLPPGFKLNDTAAAKPKIPVVASDNDDLLASLLPPGYKSKPVHPASTTSKPKLSSLPTSTEATHANETTAAPGGGGGGGLKVVFPKGFHKRLGSHRLTTPHPTHDGGDGPTSSPSVVIKKGPPTRVTTEFTGWPTPPTTPLSIEKLNAATINFEDLLTAAGGSSTTSTTTTTTTSTTTTTTPRPTKPGHCTADCDLEATIRIIEGVAWKPELLDHNTLEWKNLAHELEAQLNEVYSSAAQLSKWYKKVRIDSFSQGSVLVDYYVELANITDDVNTLEIKQLFHDALTKPVMPVLPDKDAQENETDNEAGPQEEQLVKASYQMGKFIIDPAATEFSVIAKNLHSNVELPEDDLPIPQWAIVVIVIGVGSLVFVVIFGVTVLLNRQKRAKKTPIPLTNDMLNELKVNHMGGADNYGVDDFYNIDDPWNDTKQPIKPKRFTNSMHGSNSSNIYDSWRSTRHPHSSGDYFYDQQPTYSTKGDSLKRPQLQQHHHHHHQAQQPYAGGHQQQQGYGHAAYPDAFADAHQMYSYNNHASRTRYARDYDPDF